MPALVTFPSLVTFGLEWARPLGLVGLILPVIVLLTARRLDRPRELPTGTLAVWRRVSDGSPVRAQNARPRVPPAVWLVALALAAGSLALGGPHPVGVPESRAWLLCIDTSPSMDLPLDPNDAEGETRGSAARARASRWLEDERGSADTVEVVFVDGEPSAWLEHDRPGCIWITDREPASVPRYAGWCASGGPAVPGPIGAYGTRRFDWDGERVLEVAEGARRPVVYLLEPAGDVSVSPPLKEVLEAWAAFRELEVVRAPADDATLDTLLVVSTSETSTGDGASCTVGRDGWSVAGSVVQPPDSNAEMSVEADWTTWLSHEDIPVVRTQKGLVWTGWSEMGEPRGDPAAFAVSWAQLFDEALLPPAGVVSLAERRAAGERSFRVPSEPPPTPGASRDGIPLDAALAGLAVLLTLVALAVTAVGAIQRASQAPSQKTGPSQEATQGART
jgi:hypothetical protein